MTATPRLLEIFVEAADSLVEDYNVIDFLNRLADNVVEASDADAASLLLGDDADELSLVAASSPDGEQLARLQLEHGEGPSIECFRTGSPVLVHDTAHPSNRWPAFAAEVARSGVSALQAFPMQLRGHVIGTLTVSSHAQLPLEQDDVRVVQALADIATIAIIQQRSLTAADVLTSQLQRALDSRIVIEQAKGLVAGFNQIDAGRAFGLIRDHARRRGVRIIDLARALTAHEVPPVDLNLGRPRS